MKIRTKRSREQWQELVCQWQDTQMTAIAWCRQQDISYESFIIWKNRLKNSSQPTASKQPFVELIDTTPAHSGIEIHCRDLKLTIRKNFDPEVLLQSLQVLEKV
jgi:hypothetical protein